MDLQRPLLQSHVRVLRRGPDAVQVGLVDSGIVVSGLAEDEIEQLARLDRERHCRPGRAPSDPGRRRPRLLVDSSRLGRVIDALAAHHLLLDRATPLDDLRQVSPRRIWGFAPDAAARGCAYGLSDDGFSLLAQRRHRHVLVDGEGRLGAQIARCLRDGGVGRVDSGEDAVGSADLGLRRRTGPRPDLVVIVADGTVAHPRAQSWRAHDVPHLPVVVDGPTLHVGPLVAGPGPCLRCLDLHRTDRDPQWPQLLEQLDACRPSATRPVDAESGLRALATGLVATFAYALLDGHDVPTGLATTYRLPSPQATHHVWHPLPGCRECAARATMGP